jgi:hypothetical protein
LPLKIRPGLDRFLRKNDPPSTEYERRARAPSEKCRRGSAWRGVPAETASHALEGGMARLVFIIESARGPLVRAEVAS